MWTKWPPRKSRKKTPSDRKWERIRPKRQKENEEREMEIHAREERGTFRAEQIGQNGAVDAEVRARPYYAPRAVSAANDEPLAALLEMSMPPSLTQFCALAVVRNQRHLTALTGVPWDNGGEHIVDILYATEASPSRALLGALMEEYPNFREQNSTLVLRGRSLHLQQACLQRLSDPSPDSPFRRFLTRLDLGFTNLTADMARTLSVLEALVVLDVRGTALNDDAVINLLRPTTYPLDVPALRKLSHLNLEYCNVSNLCVPQLLRTPALVAVDVSNTDVDTDEYEMTSGAWADWKLVPDRVPLFAYQDPATLPQEVCASLAASSVISNEAMHRCLTRAWQTRQHAQCDMRNEAWHYVKDIALGCALGPGEIDTHLNAFRAERRGKRDVIQRLVKVRDSHAGVAPRKSEAELNESIVPVRKRPRVDANLMTNCDGVKRGGGGGSSLDIAALSADLKAANAEASTDPIRSGTAPAATIKSFATLFRSRAAAAPAKATTPLPSTPMVAPRQGGAVGARTVPQGILRLASAPSIDASPTSRKFPAGFLKHTPSFK
ncbi:hypothetical protein BDZ88DRAFT_449420 [Geranomyces variabilis]|nr:hypothetical protein BDZ88DRAFT_449420 [Geranomyces variabilis]KAJ3142069.1 hypothetical protein HDU90_004342 [Geranomyces variabilis]